MTEENKGIKIGDFSQIEKSENPRIEKYFEMAGKCGDTNNWHSADSFQFNHYGHGEYDYNYKCPNCDKEINSREHNVLESIEKDFGLRREREHPLAIYGEESLENYVTVELKEKSDNEIVWVEEW